MGSPLDLSVDIAHHLQRALYILNHNNLSYTAAWNLSVFFCSNFHPGNPPCFLPLDFCKVVPARSASQLASTLRMFCPALEVYNAHHLVPLFPESFSFGLNCQMNRVSDDLFELGLPQNKLISRTVDNCEVQVAVPHDEERAGLGGLDVELPILEIHTPSELSSALSLSENMTSKLNTSPMYGELCHQYLENLDLSVCSNEKGFCAYEEGLCETIVASLLELICLLGANIKS